MFVDVAKPLVCRTVRLRYINRIRLPLTAGRIELDDYLRLAPRLPDDRRLTFAGFFNQHTFVESATNNQVNIVFATQPLSTDQLPLIFDIEAFSHVSCDPSDWPLILRTIESLRAVKNLVFMNSLTEKCLSLFQP